MIKFSIVVTAYNRKEFLHYALRSVQNQTIHKDLIEVILLTNFEYDLSQFSSLNIRHFIMEGSVGEYIRKAIVESMGEIICFLDDDDLFHKLKLELLQSRFSEDAVYYKNAILRFKEPYEINEKEVAHDGKIMHISVSDCLHPDIFAYNKSSISVRKSFIEKYQDLLKNVDTAEDWFLFFSTMDENRIGIYDSNQLSYYRDHQSITKKAITRSDSNFRAYVKFLHRQIRVFNFMKEVFNKPYIQKIIEYQLSAFRFRLLLLAGETEVTVGKSDLMNLFMASILNYNEFLIIKFLFLRAFIRYYFPALSSRAERIYAKASRRINSQ